MARTKLPQGTPTVNVGMRATVPMSRLLDETARTLNVTKNNLINTILEHEFSQSGGEPPVWWEEWTGRTTEQERLIGDEDMT